MRKINWAMVVLSAITALGACLIDRGPLQPAFPGTVSPNVACPGDEVTLSWDLTASNVDCARSPSACERDPLSIDITATGGMAFNLRNAPVVGTQRIRITGPEDAVISLHAYDTDQDLGTPTIRVNVLGPDELLSFPASFAGVCRGTTIAWDPMVASTGTTTLSPSVQIKRIQNISGANIRLTASFESGETRSFDLATGASTPDFTSRVTEVNAVPQAISLPFFGGNCLSGGSVGSGTPPRSIDVTVFYGCL
jgi:hypothetical protein